MARPRKTNPRYLEHKQSGRGRAIYWDAAGQYHDELLPGSFNSKESLSAFARILLEQEAGPKGAAIRPKDRAGLSVAEILNQYLAHATSHYRGPDGKETSELRNVKLTIRTLREMYADLPAHQFGPLKLKAVRQAWVVAKLARSECNRRTRITKQIFKWAIAEELLPAEVFHTLVTVSGLQKGRTPARETEPIEPVDDAVVNATLPYINRIVRGLIEFQRLTGCRPGEACALRRSDIDQAGRVWIYKPERHKNAHRGKPRSIAIGPKAQKLLEEFPTGDPTDYVFSPSFAVQEVNAERTKQRATPRYRSHMKRNRNKRAEVEQHSPKDRYTPESYSRAIARGCDRAFPPAAPLAQRDGETLRVWKKRLTARQMEELKEWQKSHRWQPNQLRHTFATQVRKIHGLEAVQVLLGHSKVDTTQIYAERNEALAVSIAAEIG